MIKACARSCAPFCAALFLLCGAPTALPFPVAEAQAASRSVVASFYGKRFHGRRTANGERFNMHAMTAAHKSLPFGTKVRVTNKANGRSVVVRINDRGPFIGGRALDLSRGAAAAIGMIDAGVQRVAMEVLG